LNGATWVKVAPGADTLFECSDKFVVKGLKTSAVAAAKINAQRIATAFGTFTPK
ncbi:MAG: hypothetical protein JWM72_4431, partial [Actinomycetia bacterium]|nr:hypothetical protein [Actinomycetes bacterium]